MGVHGPDCKCGDFNDDAVKEVANVVYDQLKALVKSDELAKAIFAGTEKYMRESGNAINGVEVRIGTVLALVGFGHQAAQILEQDFGIEISSEVQRLQDTLKN